MPLHTPKTWKPEKLTIRSARSFLAVAWKKSFSVFQKQYFRAGILNNLSESVALLWASNVVHLRNSKLPEEGLLDAMPERVGGAFRKLLVPAGGCEAHAEANPSTVGVA
jgi:hypothetical protein